MVPPLVSTPSMELPFSGLLLPVVFGLTLLSGAPWAVTKCLRKYHLFLTTLSQSEQDTP